MGEEFKSTLPIYQQIIDKLCRQITKGLIAPGEKLPSVRDLAIQFGVNPNTVQRVYQEMERMEVVETRRGQGTFVTERRELLTRMKLELSGERIKEFAVDMQEMGFTPDEIVDGVKRYFDDKRSGRQHD